MATANENGRNQTASHLNRRSISRDLIISLALVVTLVVSTVIGLNYYLLRQHTSQLYQQKADEYLTYLQDALSVPMWNFDNESIAKIAHSLMKNEIIAGLTVTDYNHQVLFSEIKSTETLSDRFHKKAPVRYKDDYVDETVGEVELVLSVRMFREQRQQVLKTSLVILAVVLVALTSAAGLLLKKFLGKPMAQLQAAIDRIADGDYAHQPDLPHRKEIEAIITRFNLMAEKIESRERALTETNTRLTAILDNTTAVVSLKDLEKRYLLVNTQFEWLARLEESAVIGKTDFDIYPESTARHLHANDEMVLEADKSMEFEEIISGPDGDLRTYLSIKFPLKDINGNTYAICGISTDITSRKQAERQVRKLNEELELRVEKRTRELIAANENLRREMVEREKAEKALIKGEALLRSTLESTVDGIVVASSDGIITHANQRFWEMWSIPQEKVLNRDVKVLRDFMQDQLDESALFLEKTQALYDSAETSYDTLRFKDGRVYERFSCPLVIDGSNRGRVWSHRDITGKKQVEDALARAKEAAEAASRAKSEFLATMSHEIRTPLNGVIGMTGLLAGSELKREQHEYVQTIQASADALLAIINDILDFSKIEAGKLDLEILDFDLWSTVETVADMLAIKAEEKQLSLDCRIQPEVPRVLKGDPGRLRQVLLNLTANAVKFTAHGSVSIEVTLVEENDAQATIRFSITDTGIGIPKELHGQLFESFSQVDSSTTRKFGGTGLGLAISKRLTQMMGGQIGLDSTEGVGSTFWFTAPFPKQIEPRPLKFATPENLRGKRILSVDDRAINNEIIRSCLNGWDCVHEVVANAPDALLALHRAASSETPFDLVIIDHMMPDMNGEDLARAIKAEPKLRDVKMIMVTSSGLRGDAHRAHEVGFDAYLTKPVKPEQLKRCILAVFGADRVGNSGGRGGDMLITNHRLKESQTASRRVLVAEDNVTNQQVARHVLKKFGYYSDVVSNGAEAVEAYLRVPYDIILMDVQMPVMDGLEATRKIRDLESEQTTGYKRMPIIAMTASAMMGDRDACLAAGMDDYLAKPIIPESVVDKIKQWTDGDSSDMDDMRQDVNDDGESVDQLPPIDLVEALGRTMGDSTFLKNLLDDFEQTVDQQLRLIDDAIENGESETVNEAAHALKGAAANLSMHPVKWLAHEIEKCGRSNRLEAVPRLMQRLRIALARLQDVLTNIDWEHIEK